MRKLLHEKWTAPICDGICDLPENLLNEFTKDIEAMAEKYAVTLNDIEKEIRETEASLVSMLSELTGSEADMKGIRELQKLLGGEANA